MTNCWNRLLWAVEMRSKSCKPDGMLIGTAWHVVNAPLYPGEPMRALLFRTRRQAREWCADARKRHSRGSLGTLDWKFRPVRVRETLTPEP